MSLIRLTLVIVVALFLILALPLAQETESDSSPVLTKLPTMNCSGLSKEQARTWLLKGIPEWPAGSAEADFRQKVIRSSIENDHFAPCEAVQLVVNFDFVNLTQ